MKLNLPHNEKSFVKWTSKMPDFTQEEWVRYGRHFSLSEIGVEGQAKLKAARVLLVGTGGLGSPTALYLAAAGVGALGLVDFDNVDLSNLHRQIIHGTSDVGRSKLDSAEDSIREINPNVIVIKHSERLTSVNALSIIAGYDFVVDGTDNFPTRYLVNDACVLLKKRNMYGSIFRFEGQATVFCDPKGPCYRCLYPEPPPPGLVPSCAEAGVLGVLPGIIGLIQATETVKAILEIGESLRGRLLLYDALAMRFQELKIRRDPECPICGNNPSLHGLVDYEAFCGMKPASTEPSKGSICSADLQQLIDSSSEFTLVDVREPYEFEVDRIPGSHLIPLGQLSSRLDEIDRISTVVVHCESGKRSAKACELLKEHGFEKVLNLEGGMVDWRKHIANL